MDDKVFRYNIPSFTCCAFPTLPSHDAAFLLLFSRGENVGRRPKVGRYRRDRSSGGSCRVVCRVEMQQQGKGATVFIASMVTAFSSCRCELMKSGVCRVPEVVNNYVVRV